MRRIAALMNVAADYPEASATVGAFSQGLAELGWTIGHNVRIEYRWYAGNADLAHKYAAELVALMPDVILGSGSVGVPALQQLTRTVPIVFVRVPILSVPAWSIVWLGQAATQPVSWCTSSA